MNQFLIISHAPPPNATGAVNGATLRFQELIQGLSDHGFSFEVVSVGKSVEFDIVVKSTDQSIFGACSLSGQLKTNALKSLSEALNRLDPDGIIILDQPFIWPVIKKLKGQQRVVYVAHNNETDTYFQLCRLWGFSDHAMHSWRSLKNLESDLVSESTCIIVCSDEDAEIFESQGGKNVVVVPVFRLQANPVAFEGNRKSNMWTFVSSSWIANWIGLIHLVDPQALKAGNIELTLVGGCVEALREDKLGKSWLRECDKQVSAVGYVNEDHLGRILSDSYGSIVPVLLGGGANLKLSEALQYSQRLISTSFGIRGYKNLGNVHIANSRAEFTTLFLNSKNLQQATQYYLNRVTFRSVFKNLH